MRFWQWVKASKAASLIAFFLPWMTVSCGSTKVMSASGWQLATGHFSVTNPVTGAVQTGNSHIDWALLLAGVCIALGLALSFRPARQAALPVLATSAAALALIAFAVRDWSREAIVRHAREAQEASAGADESLGRQMGEAVLNTLRVDWEVGFWLTIAALVATGVLAWLSRPRGLGTP